MAVVVDQVGAVRAVDVQLKPDAAGPCGAQTDVVLEDLRPGELGDHFRASLHDRRGVGRVRGRVPFAGFGGAAEDAVVGAGVDVGPPFGFSSSRTERLKPGLETRTTSPRTGNTASSLHSSRALNPEQLTTTSP